MIYTIPYLVLAILLGGAALLNTTNSHPAIKKYTTIFSIVIFLFFFGFRGFILSDWINYYPFFYECTFDDLISFGEKFGEFYEPGFVLLNLVCKSIFEDFHFFIFIHTVILMSLLLNFLRHRTDNIPLALLLFYSFDGIGIVTNLLRNIIAILIFLNALQFIEKRKPIPYFACCLLAVSFHTSAILYFPLYFFFHKTCNKWLYLGIFIACNIIFLGHISIVVAIVSLLGLDESFAIKVKAYTEFYDASTGISIGYLERLMTGTLVFLYYDKLQEVRKNNAVFINGIIAYFIMYFFLSEFDVLSKRMSYLFSYGYWIIWMDLIKSFAIENNKRLFALFIFLYCLLRVAGTAYLPDFDYENVLFGSQSYQERLFFHNKTYEGN